MSREWKPGDVAMVKAHLNHQETRVVRGFDNKWHGEDGIYRLFTDARPLVVIDPEDREQVERLELLYLRDAHNECENTVECMQDALSEFANPTPPKPEEPTGLGAVVETSGGGHWVRVGPNDDDWENPTESSTWADLDVVRVLSEGVQP